MSDLATYYLQRRQTKRATEAAAAVLTVDPVAEPMVQVQFEALLHDSDMAAALRAFRRYKYAAAREGVTPSAEFVVRYRQVLSGQFSLVGS